MYNAVNQKPIIQNMMSSTKPEVHNISH